MLESLSIFALEIFKGLLKELKRPHTFLQVKHSSLVVVDNGLDCVHSRTLWIFQLRRRPNEAEKVPHAEVVQDEAFLGRQHVFCTLLKHLLNCLEFA